MSDIFLKKRIESMTQQSYDQAVETICLCLMHDLTDAAVEAWKEEEALQTENPNINDHVRGWLTHSIKEKFAELIKEVYPT